MTHQVKTSRLLPLKRFVALTLLMSALPISASAETFNGFSIAECGRDFEDVNFCDVQHARAYQQALKEGINFHQKYALAFIGSDVKSVVAIDTETKSLTPLYVSIKPVDDEVDYSVDSDTLCFSGEIYGYRQDNSYQKVCYTLEEDEFAYANPQASGMTFSQTVSEF